MSALRKKSVTITIILLFVVGLLSVQPQTANSYEEQFNNKASGNITFGPDPNSIGIEPIFNNSMVAEPILTYEPQFIFDIYKSGDVILAHSPPTSQNQGITSLINVSNIENVTLIKFVSGHDQPNITAYYCRCSAAYMVNNLMFLSVQPYGTSSDIWFLLICDVSDPQNPALLANISMPGYEAIVKDIELVGNNLFVLSDRNMTIFDISDPSNPAKLSITELTYELEDSKPEFYATLKTLVVNGNYVYVVTHLGDLVVLDISDLSSPVVVFSGNLHCMGYDALVANDTLFVAAGVGGLYIFDVSNKSSPTLISHYNDTLRCSMGLEFLDSNILAVADNIYGLHVLNVSDLNNVYELCNATNYDRLMDIVVDGNLIFGAEMLAGIHIYNATDKTNVTSISYTPIARGAPMEYYYTYIVGGANFGQGPAEPGEYDVEFIEAGGVGVELCTLISMGGKAFFRITPIGINIGTIPIIVYNDTDGNGRLSICYETFPDNPYLPVRRVITDQVYFVAEFKNIHVKFSELKNETWNGHEAFYYTFEISGLNFTNVSYVSAMFYNVYFDEVIGNSAKGNITLTFHIIPFENTNESSPFLYDNVTVKVDINLKLFDIDWGVTPENYCIAVGFSSRVNNDLIYYPAGSLSTLRGTSLRAMDVIADIFINKNYTAVNGNYTYHGNVNVSFDYGWEDFYNNFEFVNWHHVLANFIDIPSNTTEIQYDPKTGFYTVGKRPEISSGFYLPPTRPYTGEEEQPPTGEEEQLPEEQPTPEEEGEQPPPSFGMSPTVMFVVAVVVVSVVAVIVKFVKRRHLT